MTDVKELHKKWLKSPEYKAEYEALAEEFALATAVIEARKHAGLTQKELAESIKTSQGAVSRLESGATNTTIATLQRVAEATGTHLKISFEHPAH